MKPCSKNRKLIAWLAVNALEVGRERDLRAHLKTCEGCCAYLDEISSVTEKLAVAETRSDLRLSESFHQKLADRLSGEKSGSIWETLVENLRANMMNSRPAMPLIGATALLIAVIYLMMRHPSVSSTSESSVVAKAPRNLEMDVAPTLANYETVANRSLENFDELLTMQGNRNLSPVPIYTVSSLGGAIESD